MTKTREIALDVALLLCGACIGTLLALPLSQYLQMRAGKAQLNHYSGQMMAVAEANAKEVGVVLHTVLHDNLKFCSDDELALMRRLVFDSAHVRDIGQSRNGQLYCTSSLGRFPPYTPQSKPTAVYGGVQIFVGAPLLLSPEANGIVLAVEGTSVVLNPETSNFRDSPPMFNSGFVFDPPTGRTIRAYGHDIPLTSAEILAHRLILRDGVYYLPTCSNAYSTCVVVSEPSANLISGDGSMRFGFLGTGALFGTALALILILFSSRQRTFERRLRRAIRNDDLTVAYQSVVDLQTGAIIGAEALCRWTSSQDGYISPEVFVTVAENKGFVGEITRLVLRHVIDEMGDLLRAENFNVTLNVTTQDLGNPAFFTHLEASLKAAGISASSVSLELTERSTADQTLVAKAIAELKSVGHQVYIDDFGTGYSSLAYLHKLNADAIKIDRTFTHTVGTEAVTASVVPQILEMAAQLGLQVVVEGLESIQQVEYFRRAGRGIHAQGWYFGHPAPAAAFRKTFNGTPSLLTPAL